MAQARRCNECNLDWPVLADYRSCPNCGRELAIEEAKPMPRKEAAKKALNFRFENFYQQREDERNKRGELSPEILGRLEAKEEIRSG